MGVLVVMWTGRAIAQGVSPPPPEDSMPQPAAPEPAPTAVAPTPVEPAQPIGVAIADEPERKLWLGPQLDLIPAGTLHISANGMSDSGDAGGAVGLGGLLDYRLGPNFTVGFAPRFIVPVKADGASDSGSQLDLRARVTAGKDVASRFRVHGIGTVGYSMMFHVLSDANGRYYTTAGVIFGFGAGFVWAINPKLLLVTEMSYQLGYQGTTIAGFEVAAGSSYLTLGVGVVTPLM